MVFVNVMMDGINCVYESDVGINDADESDDRINNVDESDSWESIVLVILMGESIVRMNVKLRDQCCR